MVIGFFAWLMRLFGLKVVQVPTTRQIEARKTESDERAEQEKRFGIEARRGLPPGLRRLIQQGRSDDHINERVQFAVIKVGAGKAHLGLRFRKDAPWSAFCQEHVMAESALKADVDAIDCARCRKRVEILSDPHHPSMRKRLNDFENHYGRPYDA